MTVVFLRGRHVEMRPLAPDAAPVAAHWLAPAEPRQGGILMAIAARDGGVLGRAGVVEIDWITRHARLIAGWHAGAAPPAHAHEEVVALLLAYARDELNLDEVAATAADSRASSALAGAGFVDGRWTRKDPLI